MYDGEIFIILLQFLVLSQVFGKKEEKIKRKTNKFHAEGISLALAE